jgi:hypothetical protein
MVAGLRGKATVLEEELSVCVNKEFTVVQRRLALLEEETEVNGGSIGVVGSPWWSCWWHWC